MSLSVGDPAPDFTLPDAEGNLVSLSNLRGQRVVLYFYPRDNTPGCTKEACGFRDAYADYQAQGIHLLGVSADDARSHQKFAQKLRLPFPLLVDEGAKVATAYGVFGPKKFMGKEYNGIHRTTFVIDPEGKIEAIVSKVKVETHAVDLLKQLATR
ncbi:thioredoxin-dependent thiol peroxidase [Thermostichus vulcanus]|uniref:thioredoxin-dependent peroxiredoxin n=1 Tax=Thermostichus vulcanus str. 'Rupite' TaxID=2813851 RepID=A0ABT0CEV1_THEVL|nr:thioredoxin-dependent thiol peroxidase [Thermostichus vulcanus]MCJ2544312.1 thioredoxin-dependent thiol peroxidase [Thermostichus vulcanus str. 'Rupite']